MADDSSSGALRFEILGPVRAWRGATPVDLGPIKQQALLALLLLHAGRPVPMRQIVAALWGQDPPPNSVDVVQRYVGGLRRALDPERTSLLTLTDDGYLLRAQNTDVDAFHAALDRARAERRRGDLPAATEHVRRALDLWHDQPLAGLTGAVFESARARLAADRAAASELLTEPMPAPSPAAGPAPARPAPAEPTRDRPAPAASTHAGRSTEPEPAYAEPVDPWAGHDLLPPHSTL